MSMRKDILVVAGIGVAAGLAGCEATGITNFIPDPDKPKESNPLPTEQSKSVTGVLNLASSEINDNFYNSTVIYGKLNPLDKEGLTKEDINCLNIGINGSNFNFCTFESRDGARENWWIKSPEDWFELQKVIKSGYDMDGNVIPVATWVLGTENVIWYPQNQEDWLKESENPNFGIVFLPPAVFGENPISGYDRNSGLGIKIPLNNTTEDPFSQENIFQAIAYRTGYQIGGVTPTAEPTETPTPESLLPAEVKDKFDQAGIDLTDMTNAKYDKDGFHITLESGEVIVLNNDELEKNIYLGQDNVLQYRDESNQNVVYAFDKESKTFLESSRYIQKDKTDPEKYIQVANWDELYALWAKEKMFLIPFDPENTYFPPLDNINRDYDNWGNRKEDQEFNFYYPFGKLPEGMDSPFRIVNFIRMQKDELNSKSTDTFIVSEQVFNVDNNSFSVIHFMRSDSKVVLRDFQEATTIEKFLLPRFQLIPEVMSLPAYATLVTYLKENNLIESDLLIPKVKNLVYKWFETGHVPEELETIPSDYKKNYLY